MEQKADHEPLNVDINEKGERVAMLANSIHRETLSGFCSLPETLRNTVADYMPYGTSDLLKRDLLFEQRITLGFSQHFKLDLGSCWRVGCLSPKDRLETSMKARIDKKYLIKDYKSCLDFLGHENLPYRLIAVEVLVFQLDISSQNFPGTLDDLEYTLTMLKEHLRKVQHVVFALENNTFCCFCLKDFVDKETGLRQAVDRLQALKQIISDLRTCWATNQTPSSMMLLDYYILSDDKPKSDMYLTKFVISLSHCRNRDLFDAVDPTLEFRKLYWLYNFETLDDTKSIDQRIIRRCHAFHYSQMSPLENCSERHLVELLESAYCFQDNRFIERIFIYANVYGDILELPRPSTPLADTSLRSSLIELDLNSIYNRLDLSQLNTGYFPNLTRLAVIGGKISGQLDSHRVPRLRELILEPGDLGDRFSPRLIPLIRQHTQSLIRVGHPWQLVATKKHLGWSLASYDDPTSNSQDEMKGFSLHSSPQSLPLIKELMLVAFEKQEADEWQLQLNGKPPLETTAGDHSVRRLVWAPDRVQKITAFAITLRKIRLVFEDAIPGQIRILTSLTCPGVGVALHGDVLPNLRSLEVKFATVKLSGKFPQLENVSFQDTKLESPWEINAPMMQSLICLRMQRSIDLILRPELWPHLSCLKIEPWRANSQHAPAILAYENSLGLSRVKHAVFGKGMTKRALFDECQVHKLSHLELAVDARELPENWFSLVWLCETLTINVYVLKSRQSPALEAPGVVVLPDLPLVKKLTVTEEKDCQVLLDTELPVLTDCTLPTPRSLGPKLKCPALRCIRFTGKLSDSEKDKCLSPATYEAIDAHPEWVYFDDGEIKRMSWDVAPNAAGVSSFEEPLEDDGKSSVTPE